MNQFVDKESFKEKYKTKEIEHFDLQLKLYLNFDENQLNRQRELYGEIDPNTYKFLLRYESGPFKKGHIGKSYNTKIENDQVEKDESEPSDDDMEKKLDDLDEDEKKEIEIKSIEE